MNLVCSSMKTWKLFEIFQSQSWILRHFFVVMWLTDERFSTVINFWKIIDIQEIRVGTYRKFRYKVENSESYTTRNKSNGKKVFSVDEFWWVRTLVILERCQRRKYKTDFEKFCRYGCQISWCSWGGGARCGPLWKSGIIKARVIGAPELNYSNNSKYIVSNFWGDNILILNSVPI